MEPIVEDMGGVILPPAPPIGDEREDLRMIYDNDGETRNTEILNRLGTNTIMFALFAVLLPFGFSSALKGEAIAVFIAMLELVFLHRWRQIETRTRVLLEYWNEKLILIEDLLRPVVRVFGGADYRQRVEGGRPRIGTIIPQLMFIFFLATLATLAFFVGAPKWTLYPSPPSPQMTPSAIEEMIDKKLWEHPQIQQNKEQTERQSQQIEQMRIVMGEQQYQNAALSAQIGALSKRIPPPSAKRSQQRKGGRQ